MRIIHHVTTLLALALVTAGCGAPTLQAYDGPKLPDDKVTYLWTNPHLEIAVDRQFSINEADRGKLQRIELRAGHHVAEVSCIYSDDVTWNPKPGVTGMPQRDKEYTKSGAIAVTMDGEPGHAYKLVARFELDANGTPGCRAKVIDITDDSGAAKTHLF